MKKVATFISIALIVSCNTPPLYQTHARNFLESKGIERGLIDRIVDIRTLQEEEALLISRFNNIAVLHLLAANPTIPQQLLEKLAATSNEEIRWGAALNPHTPLEMLLKWRTVKQYSTINEYLARNPNLPASVLREMYDNKEAGLAGIGLNPNCPSDLMGKIATHGSETDRAWLATNPNIDSQLMVRLENDPSLVVRSYLNMNPTYKKHTELSLPTGVR